MSTPKSVLVTGCSDNGIGSALALTFAQRGLTVFACARDPAKMSKLANLPNVHLLTLDITKPEDVRSAVAAVKKETGGTLNYLVNNAAQTRYMPLLDESPDDDGAAKELFELNVWSQLRIVQGFMPLLIEARGMVVYISSLSGHMTVPWNGIYGASKRATEIMFDTLRLELAPLGVKSVTVVTGPVKSLVHSHQDQWKVPQNSLYIEVEDAIVKRSAGEDGAPRQDTMVYAGGVVDKLLKGNDPKIWAGGNMGIIKFIANWIPQSLQDWMFIKGTGLDVMKSN